MIRLAAMAVLLSSSTVVMAAGEVTSTNKVRSAQDFGDIRRQVETLRGKTFLREVPVYKISEKELRAISDRELDKDYPGDKLHDYEELLAWLDVVPPHTDLKAVNADFLVDQVAGLYDSDAKEMCIPAFSAGTTNAQKKAAEKKLDPVAEQLDEIVLAHEFTHALEDQYWPLDVPEDHDPRGSTDRGTAHDFLSEGSATRAMIEVIPAQAAGGSPGKYFALWNLLHSNLGEFALNYELGGVWKSKDALVEGVPDALARTEAMPYSFGYLFCAGIMRDWGLNGLDYIYEHPPVSSAQVMHPTKGWQWRDFPVRIRVPEMLPGGWKEISGDCVGESGMAVLFGCQFKNLNRGLAIGRGWKGDHVTLFKNSEGHRLLVWASAWASAGDARTYASAWVKERRTFHHAVATKAEGNRVEWESPDGRAGLVLGDGKQVIVVESDDRESLRDAEGSVRQIEFTDPPEEAARAAENNGFLRFNPVWSRQKDGDYTVTRGLCGLVSRHDHNSVGSVNVYLLGLAGESHETASLNKWQMGAGLLVKHDSEARRGFSKTTLLPWGVLFSHCSARLPEAPDKTIARTSALWGLCGSVEKNGAGRRSVNVLPYGLLLRATSGPRSSSFHMLATGISRVKTREGEVVAKQFRLLGIPLWSTHPAPAKSTASTATGNLKPRPAAAEAARL